MAHIIQKFAFATIAGFRCLFRLLLKFDFYSDHALYRDSRRKVEVLVDPALIPFIWESAWNQWKHLLGAKSKSGIRLWKLEAAVIAAVHGIS